MLFLFAFILVFCLLFLMISLIKNSDLKKINESFQSTCTSIRISSQLVIASGVSIVALMVMILSKSSWREEPKLFGICAMTMGVMYLWIVYRVKGGGIGRNIFYFLLTLGIVQLIVAVGLRSSDDINRYILEGQQVINNQNPYEIPPNALGNQCLVENGILDGINHPDMTAIYPPISLYIHGLMAFISPSVYGFKILTALGGCLLIFSCLLLLLLLKKNPVLIFIVLWNPVLIIYGIGEAHNDIWVAILVTLFVFFSIKKRVLTSWFAFSLAFMCKPFAGILILFQLYKKTKGWWVFPLVIFFSILPFAQAGYGLVRSLFTFGHDMHFHGVLEPLVRVICLTILPLEFVSFSVRVTLFVILIFGIMVLFRHSSKENYIDVSMNAIALLLLCLPTLHPWYLMILLPYLPLARGWCLIVWTSMAGVYWLHGLKMNAIGEWAEDPVVTLLAHTPALLIFLYEARLILPQKDGLEV